MARFRFLKRQRLSGVSDIKAVFKRGEVFSVGGAKLFVLPNSFGYNRFMCTFKRGFGNAVVRNRTKRISKEIFRLTDPNLSQGFDLIFLVFYEDVGVSFDLNPLMRLLKQSGITLHYY